MPAPSRSASRRILLTGASGYVGGRVLPALVADGHHVRCIARRPEALEGRVPAGAEVVRGDILKPETLAPAFEGIEAAYYLVHSMASSDDFVARDRQAADNFGAAARAAGVERLIYLGGLGREGPDLSPHLRSRHEVGERLRESRVATIEFRASIIIGAGSFSFEMIRALVNRLPVMVTPSWVRKKAQPISIDDVVTYLVAAVTHPLSASVVYEIGGPDQVAYEDLMREYARQRGLRRVMIPVPVLTPRVSSLWLQLIAPEKAKVGRTLIDSIRHSTLVQNDAARRAFPIRPVGVREAIARALRSGRSHAA